MSAVCLDTSAYSRLQRGHPALRERLETADEVWVPATVLGELHAGFFLGSKRNQNARELEEFLAQPGIRVVAVTESVAERYGAIVKQLRDQGTPIPTNDIWVAAAALETGARLIAYGDHFRHVPGLLIESP